MPFSRETSRASDTVSPVRAPSARPTSATRKVVLSFCAETSSDCIFIIE